MNLIVERLPATTLLDSEIDKIDNLEVLGLYTFILRFADKYDRSIEGKHEMIDKEFLNRFKISPDKYQKLVDKLTDYQVI